MANIPNENDLGPRPTLSEYINKFSRLNLVAHEQERQAREEHAAADRIWLEREIERLRAIIKPFAQAAKHGQTRLQILENGGVGAMGCRDGFLDQAVAHLCVKEFRDALAALERSQP